MGDIDTITGDIALWNDDRTKTVTVTTDGAKERLDVQALIEGGTFQLQPFIPVYTKDATGVTLGTGSWTTLLNITSTEGKIDFIACSGASSNYKIRLTIDTVEIFDLAMSDLAAIGLSNATNVEVWAETANKNFRFHPKESPDFTDSLLIEAIATSATPLLKSIITHREKS